MAQPSERNAGRGNASLPPAPGPGISNGSATVSPDGKRFAFVQSDSTNVKLRSSIVPGDPSYPEVRETRFARVGGVIPTLKGNAPLITPELPLIDPNLP